MRAVRRSIPLLLILAASFAGPLNPAGQPVAAGQLERLETGAVVIRHHRADLRQAHQAAQATEEALQQMRDVLGVAVRPPVEIVLARGGEELRHWAGGAVPEWALGIARTSMEDGASRLVIDLPRTADMDLANDLLLTLRHELCHVALAQVEREAQAKLPVWFHEGVAIWLSGFRLGIDRRPFLDAAGAGRLIPLADLRAGFPQKFRDAELAYLQAEDFVTFLVRRGGPDTLRRLLAAFRREHDFDAAVLETFAVPLKHLEAEWAAGHRARHPFLATLWRHTSLFGVLALATIAVYLLVRWRARRRLRQWEEEDQIVAAGREEGEDAGNANDEVCWESED